MAPHSQDSIDLLLSDISNHAKTLSVLTDTVRGLEIGRARDEERDKRYEDDLEWLASRVENIYSIGRWALTAFFGVLIAAIVTFIVNGGLHAPIH